MAAQPRGDAPARGRTAGAPPAARASVGRGGRRRPLRLPRGPVAAAGGHPPELPDHRVRDDRSGQRRDPAAQRAPSRDRRDRLLGARPGALAVGPRDAGRLDDRGLRRVARATVGRPARRVLRRDAADRAGVRRARGDAPGGHRRVRRVRRGDARARAVRCVSHRSRASWPGSCFGRRWRLSRRCFQGRRAAIASALGRIPSASYAWTLWPSVGLLPASVRDDYGLAWGPRERAVAAWLAAGWRAWRPLLPRGFRQMPKALAADRRVG